MTMMREKSRAEHRGGIPGNPTTATVDAKEREHSFFFPSPLVMPRNPRKRKEANKKKL
jgi:hypothetical protein